MSAAPYINISKNEEELLIKKEYITKYNSDIIKIIIGKTKDNIIIKSNYYELKFNKDYLSLLTKTLFKTLDESFEFIENIFNENKYKIKEISSENIKLIITTFNIDTSHGINRIEKDIELILLENFENKNSLIKELFNKYINIEKEIYEMKNDNKLIKEENGELKLDNIILKKEIENIKNNNKNEIEGLQIQYMNMMNTFNQKIEQFMNRIIAIETQINMISNYIFNLMNQNNFNSMNNIFNFNNNLNVMNPYDFRNNINGNFNLINQINKKKKNVVFRFSGKYHKKPPINIEFEDDDLMSTLIEKFRRKSNFNENAKFIFNASQCYENFTAKELGFCDSSIIYVIEVHLIIFKIPILENVNFPFIIQIDKRDKVSEIIDSFISKSGLNRTLITNYAFNYKILNENITREEAGLVDNSEIYAHLKIPLDYIYIIFQSINNDYMKNKYDNIKIECLKTEKICSLFDRYRYKTDNINNWIKSFSFKLKEIDSLDSVKSVEEFGLKNESIIIVDFKVPEK